MRTLCAHYARAFSCVFARKAVPLHQILKSEFMKLGIVASVFAWKNLKEAKQRLEEAKARYNLMGDYQEAIDEYEREKEKLDIIRVGLQDGGDFINSLPGVEFAYNLQVGRIAGKKMAMRTILKVRNNSGKELRLKAAELKMEFKPYDYSTKQKKLLFKFYDGGGEYNYDPGFTSTINGGDTVVPDGGEYEMELGAFPQAEFLSEDNRAILKSWMSGRLDGKNINFVANPLEPWFDMMEATIGIYYVYQLESGEWVLAQSIFRNVPGTLQFMGYTFEPVEIPWGRIILRALTGGISEWFWEAYDEAKHRREYGA